MKRLPNPASATQVDASMALPGEFVDENFLSPLRKGLFTLIVGFGGFMLWAGLAPLDQGEPAHGVVEVTGKRKTIQHLEGGTIDEILVSNGDHVKAGDVLVRLNLTRALSDRNAVSGQYIIAQTTTDRLRAERDEADSIAFDETLTERFADDPRYQSAVLTQEQLFKTRRKALEGEISILKENLAGAENQLAGLLEVQKTHQQQIDYINRELQGVRELAKEGYLPRNRMLELERDAARLQGALSNNIVEAGRVRSQISEYNLRIVQRNQEYQKEVQSQLTEVGKEASTLADRLAALDYTVQQTSIRSPIDGSIQNMHVHTIGGVISPGATIMEVVPHDAAYVVRAELPVNAIDKVYAGLPVEITFPALNHAKTPNIDGELLTISADRITDEKTDIPYYEAKVGIAENGYETLARAGAEIRAGMPATVMIKLGERTLFNYLMKPFTERLHTSLTEK